MPLTLASAQQRSYTTPIVIAVILLAAALGAAFYFNPHRTGDLTATHTDIFAAQTTFSAPKGAMHVIGVGPEVEQDLYAVVTVRLQDDLRLPLFVDEVEARYTAADDSSTDTVAPSAADLARTEDIFPKLKSLMPHPIVMGDTVPPKGSLDGQLLLHFGNVSAQEWNARKPSTLTIHFQHQDPMTVKIP